MLELDLKYRPRKFIDVIGNDAVVKLLLSLSREHKLGSRSMMFGGPKGCGKTSLARIAARAIVCDSIQDGEPCNECISCQSVITESAENFDEFDAATQGTVDRMRNIVSELDYGSLNSKPFVFILDEAHRLTKQAQDALLKSVEDRRLIVIMCTTEPHKLGLALRSRVTEYPVVPPTIDQMLGLLETVCKEEKISYTEAALKALIQGENNCPRTCLTTLELLTTGTGRLEKESIQSYFRFAASEHLVHALSILDGNPPQALSILDGLFATEGPVWVRDNIVAAIASEMRKNVGAKPTYQVPTEFFKNRGAAWADLARQLGSIDRPNVADIEAALMAGLQVIQSTPVQPVTYTYVAPAAPSPAVSAPASDPIPVKATPAATQVAPPVPSASPSTPPPKKDVPKPPAEVEVDGIIFSKTENLTSLDSKIESSRGVSAPLTTIAGPNVEWDKTRIPMSEREFQRGFAERFKGPKR